MQKKIINSNKNNGCQETYRYNIYENDYGKIIIFIDGSLNKTLFAQSMWITLLVLISCSALILLLILLLSKKAVKPIAESYEKQKQFITDANHELKTPLTLILANLDIAEAELGINEWLEDIRYEGHRMKELVNQLVDLTRMDENKLLMDKVEINISNVLNDIILTFSNLAEKRNINIINKVEDDIIYKCDKRLIIKLFSIFLDNAVKYCDTDGDIEIKLEKNKHLLFTIENTYNDVSNLELKKLLDRFYRSDKARTFNGGYGIGLSIVNSIVSKHNGNIKIYQKEQSKIGFKITIR